MPIFTFGVSLLSIYFGKYFFETGSPILATFFFVISALALVVCVILCYKICAAGGVDPEGFREDPAGYAKRLAAFAFLALVFAFVGTSIIKITIERIMT